MADVLVLANETIGGADLLNAVRDRHKQGDAKFIVVVPQSKPRFGNVIYDEAVRDSAQVRVDLALAFMRDEGIEGTGEVGDADPFNAAMDAVGAYGINEIIISTLPATTSGWLRRDLPERLELETGLPVAAHRRRRRLRGPALRRHAGAGQPDRRRRRARGEPREAQRGGPAPLHRGRAPGLGRRAGGARRARAPGHAPEVAARTTGSSRRA